MVEGEFAGDEAPACDAATCGEEAARGATPTDAAAFFAQRRNEVRAEKQAQVAGLLPSDGMNDRAAPARKGSRMARGGDGSGGAGDVPDNCTCAHHAVANIGEEGRKVS